MIWISLGLWVLLIGLKVSRLRQGFFEMGLFVIGVTFYILSFFKK